MDAVTPDKIEDDLTRVLALARAALKARDDAEAYCRSPEKQLGLHSVCCDNLWSELERLVQLDDGRIPVLEHPAAKERRIAKNIRRQVIAEILNCAEERLEQVIDGQYTWEEPNPVDQSYYEHLHT